jgi:hypothetical protein
MGFKCVCIENELGRVWEWYSKIAGDKNFLRNREQDLEAMNWHLRLARAFQGVEQFRLVRTTGNQPDLGFDFGGKKIWVEAVCCNHSELTKERVSDTPVCEMEPLSRITQALDDKFKQHKVFCDEKCGDDDIYIIAILTARLPLIYGAPEPQHPVEAVLYGKSNRTEHKHYNGDTCFINDDVSYSIKFKKYTSGHYKDGKQDSSISRDVEVPIGFFSRGCSKPEAVALARHVSAVVACSVRCSDLLFYGSFYWKVFENQNTSKIIPRELFEILERGEDWGGIKDLCNSKCVSY